MFFCDKLFGWEQLVTGCIGVLSCGIKCSWYSTVLVGGSVTHRQCDARSSQLSSTKLHCLAHVCEKVAQDHYMKVKWPELNPQPHDHKTMTS